MNILVTGGLGFIGSHFIKYLLSVSESSACDEYIIYNMDNMSYGANETNVSDCQDNKKYFFIRADINDISKINNIPEIEIIVNIAAESHVDRSIVDPRPFIESNYHGTFELLEYARRKDVSRYVQISTDEVYGEAAIGQFFKESDPLNPSNPYSASKSAADLLVKAFYRTYGLNGVITRCTNNFGPNQYPEKLVPKTIIRILRNLPVYIYGNGEQVRDWLYVDNHVRAIYDVMLKGRSGEIYNISTSNLMTNVDMVKKISLIVKELTNREALVKFTGDRPGHDRRYSLNSKKINTELGWMAEIDFSTALLQTVKWYLANEPWWSPLVNDSIVHPQPWMV